MRAEPELQHHYVVEPCVKTFENGEGVGSVEDFWRSLRTAVALSDFLKAEQQSRFNHPPTLAQNTFTKT